MKRAQLPLIKRLGVLVALATALACLQTAIWLAPQVAAWVAGARWPALGFWHAQALFLALLYHAHPSSPYPPAITAAAHDHTRFALVAAMLITCEVSLVVAMGLRLDRALSRPVADRRWFDPRGLRPRAFARPHTIDELLITAPDPSRIVIGRYGQALLAVQENLQTLVVAAPRSGKTSGLVIPAILEHTGPVINTTVRTDVRDHTIARRRALGNVWVWDPFGQHTDGWDLLHGCDDWSHALHCARWLTSAQSLGTGGNTEYFSLEAEQLLAPLMHAAALWRGEQPRTMRTVYAWVQARAEQDPMATLAAAGAHDAIQRLQSVYAYNDRQRDGIIGAAAAVLQAYGNPAVQRTLTAQRMLTPEALFAPDQTNTLYIVADREHQKLLAPLVVTLISTLLHHVATIENAGHPLRPSCLCALDETANIAPLGDLPEILATSLPSVRFMTVWHSISQIQRHYQPHGAAELLALSQAKIFLGSVTDRATVDELTRLMANNPTSDPLASDERASQALQRTAHREGLLIHTHKPPTFFRQRRYYQDEHLKALAASKQPATRRNHLLVLAALQGVLGLAAVALLTGPRMALIATITSAALLIAPSRLSTPRCAATLGVLAICVIALNGS